MKSTADNHALQDVTYNIDQTHKDTVNKFCMHKAQKLLYIL